MSGNYNMQSTQVMTICLVKGPYLAVISFNIDKVEKIVGIR